MESCFCYWCSLWLWSCKFCILRSTKDALHPNPVNSWVVKSPLLGEKPQFEILQLDFSITAKPSLSQGYHTAAQKLHPSSAAHVETLVWCCCRGTGILGWWQEQHWAQLCSPAHQFVWLLGPHRDWMPHLPTPSSALLPQAMRAFIPAVPSQLLIYFVRGYFKNSQK